MPTANQRILYHAIQALKQHILQLDDLIKSELMKEGYDEKLVVVLLQRQFELYTIMRHLLSTIVGENHLIVAKFDDLIFERALANLLFQNKIIFDKAGAV